MSRRLVRMLLPSPADMVFVGTLFLVLWLGSFISNRDGDLGWHIVMGQVILNTGAIPTQDILSYTLQGQPFVPHEWLAEVVFAASYSIGGFDGVALVTAVVIAATFAGLTAVMLRRGVSALVVGPLVLLGVLASIAHWAARPHLFTLLFTFLWATALEEHRRKKDGRAPPLRGLWPLLPLMLVWVNTHGAFVIGDGLTATYLAGAVVMGLVSPRAVRSIYWSQARDLALLLVLGVLISGLNPVGFGLLSYAGNFLSQDFLRAVIPELHSPDFHNPLFLPLLALLMLALAASVRRELTPLLLLTSWGAFSLISFRNLDQFVVICLPLLGESTQALLAEGAARLSAPADAPAWLGQVITRLRRLEAQLQAGAVQVTGGVPALLAVAVVALLFSKGVRLDLWQQGYGFSEQAFPIAAIAHLEPFPPGQRVFNDAQWGGYLSFCCWPRVYNFVDGRVDTYGAAYMRDYQRVLDAEPGWQEVLDRYRVDWVMIFADRPLARWLERDTAWQRLYADETAVVFVRRQPLQRSDWGLGIRDWGLGSPIPNPQSRRRCLEIH